MLTLGVLVVIRPLQTGIVGWVEGTIVHPECKEDRQGSQDLKSKKHWQVASGETTLPESNTPAKVHTHVQSTHGAWTPEDPSSSISPPRPIGNASRQNFRNGSLLRCTFRSQVHSVSLVADCPPSVHRMSRNTCLARSGWPKSITRPRHLTYWSVLCRPSSGFLLSSNRIGGHSRNSTLLGPNCPVH